MPNQKIEVSPGDVEGLFSTIKAMAAARQSGLKSVSGDNPNPCDVRHLGPDDEDDDDGAEVPGYRNCLTCQKADDELWEYVRSHYGVEVPRHKVCEEHDTPFEAFANAYYARDEVAMWLGSRGLGGKTFTEALLCFVEETTIGADVVLLGGSLDQAIRGHEYTTKWWNHDNAPRHLLIGDPTARRTRLTNGGQENVQAASSKSVRGAHPNRLRIDEVDETTIEIIDSALGQPMSRVATYNDDGEVVKRGIPSHVLFASTHHYPHGTVTELKKRSSEQPRGWRVYSWCWRESLVTILDQDHPRWPGDRVGWLTQEEVDKAKRRVSAAMFKIEYDLQEPSVEGRAITGEAVDITFDGRWGRYSGAIDELLEFPCCELWYATQTPCLTHKYATGVDWGKQRDFTVITTYRMDVSPWWMVAVERTKDLPWDVLIEKAATRAVRYPGKVTHDQTGIGVVAHDFLNVDNVKGIKLNGGIRTTLFTQYVLAIERGDIMGPRIESLWYDHYYVTNKDLFQGGHPPDSFIAGAMAWACRDGIYDISLAPIGVHGQSRFSNVSQGTYQSLRQV